jgi:outer membrane protein TolC
MAKIERFSSQLLSTRNIGKQQSGKMIMRTTVLFLSFLLTTAIYAQTNDSLVLGFREYLGYVKKYHPVVKQADLIVDMAAAEVMKARGGFDPKIAVDYDLKEFKGSEYYDLLNATFKIPTWYGIELKGTFEQTDGQFLNPERTLPDDGLYSAGISFSLGQDFLINERMATLKKARYFELQSAADRQLLVNQILFEASVAYFNWVKSYQETAVFENILSNAQQRFAGVKRSAEIGDKAAIDTVEARITLQDRLLNLEQSRLALLKSALEVSNFLWLNDNIPLELQPDVIPDISVESQVDLILSINEAPLNEFDPETHPKLQSLRYKIEGLEVEKRLKANKLLPIIDLSYNFLTEEPLQAATYNTEQYKGGIRFAFPLFLRKERGDLKLAKFKLQDAGFQYQSTQLVLRNKLTAIYNELGSLERQNELIRQIVNDYEQLLSAEERKFGFGESSLFLVNSREQKFIESSLKQIEIQNKSLNSKASLFNTLVTSLDDL